MSFSASERDLDFSKWKVADLKKELKLRGLNSDGKKSDLILRLQLAFGGSGLLDDTVNDQDELLDEDVLMDEEVDALEDSDLKSDTLDTIPEGSLEIENSKGKPVENESLMQQKKKVTLNRNFVSVEQDAAVMKGKENKTHTESKINEKTNIVKIANLTQKERLERRAAKFGIELSEEAKKQARAARFGLTPPVSKAAGSLVSTKVSGSSVTNIDILKRRAERFGTTLPGSMLEKAEIEEKKKKREERFGKVEPMPSQYKMKTKLLDQKKLLRAQRFKLNP